MTDIAGISIVQPSEGVPLHFLVRMTDGSFVRKNVHPIHALRLSAELLNGAAFLLGKERTEHA